MRQCERAEEPRVHSDELDGKTRRTGKDEVPAQHNTVSDARSSPSHEAIRNHYQRNGFIELSRMNGNVGRRQTLWKRDCPRKTAWTAVIVTDQKAPNAADRMSDRKCWRGSR